MTPMTHSDELSDIFCSGMGYLLGDGRKVLFWSNEWTPGVILKFAFPRIFALSINQLGKVCEYGSFQSNGWVWSVSLRRNLFNWEVEQWNHFLTMISEYQLCTMLSDSIIWKGDARGKYSFNSFCRLATSEDDQLKQVWKLLWDEVAPPKVKFFCLQMIRGRVAVKEELYARGLLNNMDLKCGLCQKEVESVKHLFFLCEGGVKLPMELLALFMGIWKMLFFATAWTIWIARNDKIFNSKDCEVRVLQEVVKMRVAHWVHAKWSNNVGSIMDIARSPNLVSFPVARATSRGQVNWRCPAEGFMKFNVDGASAGNPGMRGIGGVLRDNFSVVKIVFSKHIGVSDSSTAEILAVREAIVLFSQSQWVQTHRLIKESDSLNTVKWLKNPVLTPWRLRKFAVQVINLGESFLGWSINHTYREANELANSLAKSGIQRSDDFIAFY
ncbi:hypothetical protein DITRI_Ditri15bG0102200 [Diplodiscus trichospermus]